MPGCCAAGCTNRTGHDGKSVGKMLFSIPFGERNKKRRAIWLQRINRNKYFEATKNTRLCEDHFTEDQFERNRADGLRKLKPNALPSIFSTQPWPRNGKSKTEQVLKDQTNVVVDSLLQTSSCVEDPGIPLHSIMETCIGSSSDCYESHTNILEKLTSTNYYEQNRQALKDHAYVSSRGQEQMSVDLLCPEIPLQSAGEIVIVNDDDYSEQSRLKLRNDNAIFGIGEQVSPNIIGNEISLQFSKGIVIESVSGSYESDQRTDANYHSYHKGAHYADEKIASLKRMLMNEGKKRRKAEEERDRLKKSLGKILGKDQLHLLEKGKMRGSSWSESTMKKAMQLRMVCGNRGYSFVKNHVVPLPSERTLQKHIVKMGLIPTNTPCTATILSHGGTSDGQLTCDVFELHPG